MTCSTSRSLLKETAAIAERLGIRGRGPDTEPMLEAMSDPVTTAARMPTSTTVPDMMEPVNASLFLAGGLTECGGATTDCRTTDGIGETASSGPRSRVLVSWEGLQSARARCPSDAYANRMLTRQVLERRGLPRPRYDRAVRPISSAD